ncbi:MAG: DUF2281 domain-containing protein [Methylococcaceae bacterium]|nr:DUF2281 domain-containing protein [Methylococcaceae bacterium]
MNTAEMIYQEAKTLPDNLGAEVLDFIGYLKSRYHIAEEGVETAEKIDALETLFAPYRHDLSSFRFDREEANER